MGRVTGIAWCDHTFSPWWGCLKVSPGCAHCYAEREAHRRGQDLWGPNHQDLWGPNHAVRLFDDRHWHEPIRWNRAAERAGVNRRVFCGSMCDVFEAHPTLDLQYHRDRLWALIEATPALDWLLLTKRPENISRMLPERWHYGSFPRNIWMGVSAEDQERLDQRWTVLDSETHYLRPSVLFLSAEPLLGELSLADELEEIDAGDEEHQWWTRSPDWVIVGGESQPGCRPMDLVWAASLVGECRDAGVPVFVKQLGGHPDKRADPSSWPEELRIQQFPGNRRPKSTAGVGARPANRPASPPAPSLPSGASAGPQPAPSGGAE